jgi:hypothetical protein|tara:strand:+ start:4511 stop:4696 length:186 start_codon:yes stop_codon:yes gene_type:complete
LLLVEQKQLRENDAVQSHAIEVDLLEKAADRVEYAVLSPDHLELLSGERDEAKRAPLEALL